SALPQKIILGLAVRNREQVVAEAADKGHPIDSLQAVVLENGVPWDKPRRARPLFETLGWPCGRPGSLPARIQLELQAADGTLLARSAPIPLDSLTGINTNPVPLAPWATHRLREDFHFEEGGTAMLGNGLEELRPGRQILGGVLFNVEDAVIDL